MSEQSGNVEDRACLCVSDSICKEAASDMVYAMRALDYAGKGEATAVLIPENPEFPVIAISVDGCVDLEHCYATPVCVVNSALSARYRREIPVLAVRSHFVERVCKSDPAISPSMAKRVFDAARDVGYSILGP